MAVVILNTTSIVVSCLRETSRLGLGQDLGLQQTSLDKSLFGLLRRLAT